MNGVFLYEAMGGIRPAYVDEAEKQTFAKPRWKKLLPLAACLMIVVGLSPGTRERRGWLPAGACKAVLGRTE